MKILFYSHYFLRFCKGNILGDFRRRFPVSKLYDIRGKVRLNLTKISLIKLEKLFRINYCKEIVVGYDIRKSSFMLAEALANGLTDGGADVINIGLCGNRNDLFCYSF